MLDLTDKMDYLEGQSKRNNLIIDGIEETQGETWTETEQKVQNIFKEQLQLKESIEVERAHRTGRYESRRPRPRPVVVKFEKYRDKTTILQRAKYLKGT